MKSKIISLLKEIKIKNDRLSIGFLGIGTTNRAILDIITSSGIDAEIRLRQSSGSDLDEWRNRGVRLFTDERERVAIDEDVLFVSPSVRRENLPLSGTTLVITDTDLFFSDDPDGCFLITGSDGKSTTTTLVAELLREDHERLFVGGNLGTPVARCDLSVSDTYVLELSSFNLRYLTPASRRAVITNITPNHLNWHADYDEYVEAKRNIIKRSAEPIVNVDTEPCAKIAKEQPLFAVCSSMLTHKELIARYRAEHTVTVDNGIALDGSRLLDLGDIYQRQAHTPENLASAVAMTIGLVNRERIRKVAASFRGLEHRCECFLSRDGIDYVNSSIDTTPSRTSATLKGLYKRVKIILGGRGKGLPLSPLRDALASYADEIAMYGDIADEISDFIEKDPILSAIPHASFTHLGEAIDHLLKGIKSGDTLLLSPAATSYGEFRDFEERGSYFKSYIAQNCSKI